jgi:fatty acid-binding protein DegV
MERITAEYGTCDFMVNNIGPVIGAHTGPGTVALMFLANSEREKDE